MYKTYYVYILTNTRNTVLYTGVTNNIERRLEEHRSGAFGGFSAKYQCHKLVYLESFSNIEEAIAREKRIKGWVRSRKNALIESLNPDWKDLADS